MLTPGILPRVKKSLDFTRCRIASRNVRSFVTVAVQAGESQIPEIAASAVLSGDNVIYLKRERVIRKRNAAVLASGAGAMPDLFYQPRIHSGEAESSWVVR
jgi:hypothetical protein